MARVCACAVWCTHVCVPLRSPTHPPVGARVEHPSDVPDVRLCHSSSWSCFFSHTLYFYCFFFSRAYRTPLILDLCSPERLGSKAYMATTSCFMSNLGIPGSLMHGQEAHLTGEPSPQPERVLSVERGDKVDMVKPSQNLATLYSRGSVGFSIRIEENRD